VEDDLLMMPRRQIFFCIVPQTCLAAAASLLSVHLMLELLKDLVNIIVLLILVVFLFVVPMKLSQVCLFKKNYLIPYPPDLFFR
jgi:hypothetical protein